MTIEARRESEFVGTQREMIDDQLIALFISRIGSDFSALASASTNAKLVESEVGHLRGAGFDSYHNGRLMRVASLKVGCNLTIESKRTLQEGQIDGIVVTSLEKGLRRNEIIKAVRGNLGIPFSAGKLKFSLDRIKHSQQPSS